MCDKQQITKQRHRRSNKNKKQKKLRSKREDGRNEENGSGCRSSRLALTPRSLVSSSPSHFPALSSRFPRFHTSPLSIEVSDSGRCCKSAEEAEDTEVASNVVLRVCCILVSPSERGVDAERISTDFVRLVPRLWVSPKLSFPSPPPAAASPAADNGLADKGVEGKKKKRGLHERTAEQDDVTLQWQKNGKDCEQHQES